MEDEIFDDTPEACGMAIEPLNHRELAVAERIHAVQRIAYAQEAQLLGVSEFPPLQRGILDVQASIELFFGAYLGGALVGVVAVEPAKTAGALCISSLVVAPAFQRLGVASALLAKVVSQHSSQALIVSTGAGNAPALALYSRFGFVEFERHFVGTLELVQLCKPSSNPSIERTSSGGLGPLPAAAHVKRWARR